MGQYRYYINIMKQILIILMLFCGICRAQTAPTIYGFGGVEKYADIVSIPFAGVSGASFTRLMVRYGKPASDTTINIHWELQYQDSTGIWQAPFMGDFLLPFDPFTEGIAEVVLNAFIYVRDDEYYFTGKVNISFQ
jgi:hypothetical protein